MSTPARLAAFAMALGALFAGAFAAGAAVGPERGVDQHETQADPRGQSDHQSRR